MQKYLISGYFRIHSKGQKFSKFAITIFGDTGNDDVCTIDGGRTKGTKEKLVFLFTDTAVMTSRETHLCFFDLATPQIDAF